MITLTLTPEHESRLRAKTAWAQKPVERVVEDWIGESFAKGWICPS